MLTALNFHEIRFSDISIQQLHHLARELNPNQITPQPAPQKDAPKEAPQTEYFDLSGGNDFMIGDTRKRQSWIDMMN